MGIMKYQDHSYYHLYNRGAHKANIFISQEDYQLCLDLLSEYSMKYSVSLVAYCLMPNHYHLVLRQEEGGSLSRCIQTTFNAFSQTINLQQNHSGTLFQGKAKAKLIDSDMYVVQVVRYIHLNPIRAGLVKRPEDWLFSDYSTRIGKRKSPIAESGLIFQYFASRDEYRLFVEQYKEELDKQKIEKYF
jgi:REP element-mobilizing transposase RayT